MEGRRVNLDSLEVGMYVLELLEPTNCDPEFKVPFVVANEGTLRLIYETGAKGALLPVSQGNSTDPKVAAGASQLVLGDDAAESYRQASRVLDYTTDAVKSVMSNVRSGKNIHIEELAPAAESIIESAYDNPHALSAVTRIKDRDNYTFQHCVGVAALLIGFARELGLDDATLTEIALGGLLHDIGKVRVPDHILNKPGKLDDTEFRIMRDHVRFSEEILRETPGVSQIALDIALQHHERPDGKGYPYGLKDHQISLYGSMGTIVDVYDALTTKRVYKEAWEPTEVLRRMMEGCPGQFVSDHLQRFIKFIGIYPIGSWVQLDSGEIGMVSETTSDLLRPVISVNFSGLPVKPIAARRLDLSTTNQRIESDVKPDSLGIDEKSYSLVPD